MVRDVRLGRVWLLTYNNDFDQQLGDALDVVGGGVVAGERRARSMRLSLPVHGDGTEADPYASSERMRRQIISLMENTRVKLQALYWRALPDPDINGWLVIGGGDFAYGVGGPSLADFTLQFSDVYRVASQRTHRAARRTALYDRRIATTPRDYLRTVYGTDYAAVTALPVLYLPIGATDVTGLRRVPYTGGTRTGQGGAVQAITGMANAEVLSYEQAEASMGLQDDVVFYDRRGRGDIPAGYGTRVLLDGPLAWWRLDEAGGATAAADSGVAGLYAGTYVGAPTLRQPSLSHDPNTYSGMLSGADGSYVKIADQAALHLVGNMSVEGLLQPVGGAANLVDNPSMEIDTVGWASGNDANVTVGTFARSVVWSAYGTASLRIAATSTAGAAGTARGWGTTATGLSGMPVIAGRVYTARAEANVTTAPNGIWLRLQWYDAAGAALTSADGAVVTGAGVKTVSVSATAPAGATYAAVLTIVGVGTSGSADVSFDGVTLAEGATAQPYSAARARYDVVASKWQSTATRRAWRFAYDFYTDQLVYEVSTDGTARVRATSNALGLAAAVLAAGSAATPVVHVACAYNAALGRVTFYYNGAQVGQVTGLPTSIFAATTTIALGKWEADLV